MRSTTILLALLLIISSCGQGTTNTAIKEDRTTLEEENTLNKAKAAAGALFLSARQLFRMNSNKTKVVKTDKGSRVTIPKDSFIYKESREPVTGEVDIEFIEYSTIGEIIASGIPMVYTGADSIPQQFESAGMFEISASKDDKELALAEGKTIKVELATDVDGNFNFYELDDERKNWELKDTDCYPVPNKYKVEQEVELEEAIEAQPAAPKTVISYKKGDRLFDVKLHNQHDPMFKTLNGVMWKYTGSDPKKDPTLDPKFRDAYELVNLEPIDTSVLQFRLSFSNDIEKIQVIAAPVFKGRLLDRENARISGIFEEIAKYVAQQKALELALEQESKLLRVFNISKLAVYNYDRQYKDPRTIGLNADFVLADGESTESMNIYLIPTEKRVVVKYTPYTKERFRINLDERNKLIAISENSTVYFLSIKDVASAIKGKVEGGSVRFTLKTHPDSVTKPEDLDKLLGQL